MAITKHDFIPYGDHLLMAEVDEPPQCRDGRHDELVFGIIVQSSNDKFPVGMGVAITRFGGMALMIDRLQHRFITPEIIVATLPLNPKGKMELDMESRREPSQEEKEAQAEAEAKAKADAKAARALANDGDANDESIKENKRGRKKRK